jgi:hypothetical protein
MEVKMKYVISACMLAAWLATPALAESAPCKAKVYGHDGKLYCKDAPKTPPQSGGAMTATERESLDRAHTRALLEDIDRKLRRQQR